MSSHSKEYSTLKDRLIQVVFFILFVGLPLLFGYCTARIVGPGLHASSWFWNAIHLACYVVPAMFLGFFVSLVVACALAGMLFGVRDDTDGGRGRADSSPSDASPE